MGAIIFILVVLAYCFFLKLIEYAIYRRAMDKEDTRSEAIRGMNKSESITSIKLALQKSSDHVPPESGETITLFLTDKDSFHEEWEIIDDDEEKPN